MQQPLLCFCWLWLLIQRIQGFSNREIIKIFNRFADKELLLDVPGAGMQNIL